MKWLTSGHDLDNFFDQVSKADERVLMTDYDGTLSPFIYERDRAVPYIGVRERFQAIADTGRCRIVVITGRTVEDQQRMMQLDRPVEIWGTHGWERQTPDGHYEVWPIGESCANGIQELVDWARGENYASRLEIKPASVALHWRSAGAGEREYIEKVTRAKMEEIIAHSDLVLHEFDGGLELRTPGRDKGVAVRTFLEELGDDPMVVYMGDDSTDEDAFKELGDRALRILVRTEVRETRADLWLRPPRELLRFLERWQSAIEKT